MSDTGLLFAAVRSVALAARTVGSPRTPLPNDPGFFAQMRNAAATLRSIAANLDAIADRARSAQRA